MSFKPRHVIGLTAWVAAAFGSLSLSLIPGDYTHALCGAWG